VITFDPVTPAPLATRIARVVLPLLTCFGYLAFRAYPAAAGRIPLGEAVVTGLVIMGLAMVACIALGDLISRARRRPGSEELEITAVHARIADADTVVAQACAAETARLDALIGFDAPRGLFRGVLPADWGTQHLSAYNAQVRRALSEDTQPYDLLTHEFQPQHHTPPGGFVAPPAGAIRLARPDLLPPEIYIPASDTGRHHRDED